MGIVMGDGVNAKLCDLSCSLEYLVMSPLKSSLTDMGTLSLLFRISSCFLYGIMS